MNFFQKIKAFASKHKITSVIVILFLFGGGYWWYKSANTPSGATRYVLSATSIGTINSSVSGTGQVFASNQLTLSPGSGASGKVVYLNAVSGQKASAGTLLLELDTTQAEKSVRNAQASLDSAQIALQKLVGDNTLAMPQNKQNAINNEQNAEDALNQDYQSAYNTVSNVFIDLPGIMTDLQNTIYRNNFNNYQANIDFYTSSSNNYNPAVVTFHDSLVKSYKTASDEYAKNFNDYKTINRLSDNNTIDSTLSETYNTMRDVAQAIKDTNNLIQFYKDALAKYNIKYNSLADAQLTTANADAAKTDSDLSNLLNIQNAIKTDKQTIANDKNAIASSDLDIKSQQLSVQNAQNSLQDAKDNLANYYIYAPFDGVIGSVSVQKGDTISSGASAITFIAQTDYTTISLSEIDVTKIKLGNKAMLTFDAISGLSIAGQVTEIDTIGTVSQGVVSYGVKITFATQDSRIRPGMSVNASVITQTEQNVLMVPNSAVKTKNGGYYVLELPQKENLNSLLATQGFISLSAPVQKTVQTGIADDTNTEITSGLSEGDQVVVRTIAGTSTKTATPNASTTSSATRIITGGGGGGGFGGGRPGN